MFKQVFQGGVAMAALAIAAPVSAGVITASDSWNGQSSVTVGDVTISAYSSLSGQGAFIGTKNIPGVGAGAGVQGQGNNEIDWFATNSGGDSEVLSFNFGTASVIESLQLGLLFDGPEYTDFQEAAGFNVTFADYSTESFTLRTQYPGGYSWNGSSGTWVGTGLGDGQAGLWTGFNPFGDLGVLQIDFFSRQGTCGTQTACTDQSDYVFHALRSTPVPLPGVLGLLGAGLLGMGLVTRSRRRQLSAR